MKALKNSVVKPLLAVPLWGSSTNRVRATLTVVKDPVSRFATFQTVCRTILTFLTLYFLSPAYAQTPKQDFKWVVKPKYESIQIVDDSLILVELSKNTDLYGFIDKSGKIVIEPQFIWVSDFKEGLAEVQIDRKLGWINKRGQIIIKPQFDWNYSFKDDLAEIQLDGKVGFVNKAGEVVIKPQFEKAEFFSEGLVAIQLNNKWGFIDKTGKAIVEPQFEKIESFSEGLAAIQLNNKWGFIDKTGKAIVEPQFEKTKSFSEGIAAIQLNNKWGYIDKTGKVLVESQFEKAESFSGDLAAIRIAGKWGFIDKKGNKIIYPKYNDIEFFKEGLAAVKIEKKWGFIDKTGKIVIECQFDNIEPFSDGLAKINLTDKWGFIDKTGKIVIECQFDDIDSFSDGLARINLAGEKRFIIINCINKTVFQSNFNKIDNIGTLSEELMPAYANKKWGFIDKTGNKIIDYQYQQISRFKGGLAPVKTNKWGFINKTGKLIIPHQFDDIKSFSEELVGVKVSDKWGFINKTGKLIIPHQFDDIKSFSEELAGVKVGDKWGFINKTGKLVLQCQFAEIIDWDGFQRITIKDYFTRNYGIIQLSQTPPSILLDYPKVNNSKSIVKEDTLIIKGKILDDIGVRSVVVNGKSAFFLDSNGEFVVTDLPLFEGENKVSIEAEDVNANVSTLTFSVVKEKDSSTPTKNPTLGQLSSQNYHALIIGVQDYEDKDVGNLKKPLQDTDSLIKTLTTFYQFDKQNMTQLRNPTRAEILKTFRLLQRNLTENDNLLIFYAGHGYLDEINKKGYWFPKDALSPSKDDPSNWLSNDELKTAIGAMKCKHVLLITDACFAGTLFREVKNNQPTTKQSTEEMMAILGLYKKKSRQAITSGKLTVVADESKFLQFLLLSLQDNTKKYLRTSELFNSFTKAVMERTRQTPELGVLHEADDQGGEFIFIRKE